MSNQDDTNNNNNNNNSNIFDKIKHLEEESIDLETKAAEKEQKLSYLVTLIKEGRDKDNFKISQLKDDLKLLREQAQQLKLTSISTIEQIKQDIIKLEENLDTSKKKSQETEVQIQKALSISNSPNTGNEIDKNIKESQENYNQLEEKYNVLVKESKENEEKLKDKYHKMQEQEKKVKEKLESYSLQ